MSVHHGSLKVSVSIFLSYQKRETFLVPEISRLEHDSFVCDGTKSRTCGFAHFTVDGHKLDTKVLLELTLGGSLFTWGTARRVELNIILDEEVNSDAYDLESILCCGIEHSVVGFLHSVADCTTALRGVGRISVVGRLNHIETDVLGVDSAQFDP